MCLNKAGLVCESRDSLTKRQKNLCNDRLGLNRDIVCCVLSAVKSQLEKPVKCLEGIGICGINGLLWKQYFKEEVDVSINGAYEEDARLIGKNVDSNGLNANVLHEDPCVLLRKNDYDFVYLNCSSKTSQYLDSVFSCIKEGAIFVISTAEDPSLYWQMPDAALRSYGGTITKTSYHREVSVRLVMAEMARACAKYNKGLKILCTIVYKPQQSFTIVLKIKKGADESAKCLKSIKRLAHCNICESRKFLNESNFLDKQVYEFGCSCSKTDEGRVIVSIGPLWTGDIFDAEFIECMIKQSKGLPDSTCITLLEQILQEARCFEGCKNNFLQNKKPKLSKCSGDIEDECTPYFYFNSHRLGFKDSQLQKTKDIVRLLETNGFHASKTHFDPEAVRTNATLNECIRVLKNKLKPC